MSLWNGASALVKYLGKKYLAHKLNLAMIFSFESVAKSKLNSVFSFCGFASSSICLIVGCDIL